MDATKAKRRGPKPDPSRDYRTSQRDLMRRKRAEARDVAIPKSVDPKRRAATENNPVLFALSYFPHLVYLSLADLHRDIIELVKALILQGGRQAIAAPRGHGKDTLILIIILWAICHGRLRFVLLLCANGPDAASRLADIKHELETNDLLAEDFPEICTPIRALEGAPQRARSQTVQGERTHLVWGAKEIRLPDVPGSPASGSWIASRGIDGQILGITKEGKRPDFWMGSDLETEDSVESEVMTESIRRKIDRGLDHIGGPGKKLSGVILCTIRKRGCIADEFTDPKSRPAWNGRRFQAILAWPERADLWGRYIELRQADQEKGDATGRTAHEFYLDNRDEMDRGAIVVWPERFIADVLPDGTQIEASALQGYYNVIADNKEHGWGVFASEFQNDPPNEDDDEIFGLTPALISQRVNGHAHRVIPEGFEVITQGIDLRQTELHYTVVAWKRDDTGVVVDYAYEPYPVELDPDLKIVSMKEPLRAKIAMALRLRRESLASGYLLTPAGAPAVVDLTFVDAGWMPEVVHAFCRDSGSRWLPCYGRGRGHRLGAFRRPNPAEGVKLGSHFYAQFDKIDLVWRYFIDVDYWKHRIHEGFLQAVLTESSLSLFGHEPKDHRLFAKHICSEHWNPETEKWEGSKWNHFLDCMVYACAAAERRGIRRGRRTAPAPTSPTPAKRTTIGRMDWFKR